MADKKPLKLKTFTVLKEFTTDKKNIVGSKVELSNEKTIKYLLTNKFIK